METEHAAPMGLLTLLDRYYKHATPTELAAADVVALLRIILRVHGIMPHIRMGLVSLRRLLRF